MTLELAAELLDDLHAVEETERAAYDAEKVRTGDKVAGITPSDLGRCRRAVMYRETETARDEGWTEDRLAAIVGSALHNLVADARRARHPEWWVEQRLAIPGLPRKGRLDAYDSDRKRVDDVKTKSGRAMDRLLGRGRADDGDKAQADVYALAAENAGADVRTVTITYLNREAVGDDDASERVWVDEWSYSRADSLEALARLHAVQDALDDGVELPRDERGPGSWACDHCAWLARCWELSEVPAGHTAQSWRAAPEEVAEAARRLVVVRAKLAELRDAEDALRPVLVGHRGVTFTDADGAPRVLKWSRGSGPDEGGQLDSKRVRARYAELGEEPPTLGTAPRLTLPVVR